MDYIYSSFTSGISTVVGQTVYLFGDDIVNNIIIRRIKLHLTHYLLHSANGTLNRRLQRVLAKCPEHFKWLLLAMYYYS